MSAGQVAHRYATGWLSAAKDKNAHDSVARDTDALRGMIRNSPELRAFLASPLISKADQVNAITAIAAKGGFDRLTAAFLGLLAEKRRLAALPAILEAVKTMLEAQAGSTHAQVTSAVPLDDRKIADIRNQLVKKLGKDIAIETKIDPEIIGGLIVRVGSTMIDDSVKTKLDRMARRLQDQAA